MQLRKPPKFGLPLAALMVASVWILSAGATQAAETDNFHGRDSKIADALPELDDWVNRKLEEAAALANQKPGCPTDSLHKAITQVLGGMPFGAVENYADETKSVAKVAVPNSSNIYRKNRLFYTGLAVPSCSPMIRLAGKWTGTDKLGHFFSEGFDYYRHGKGSIIDAFRYGSQTEKGYFGMETTGVRSYADLAANYGGLNFYRSVLGGESPYFQCRGDRFIRLPRRFTWKDYINEAWDEALNCSTYTEEVKELVSKNMTAQNLKCPVDEGVCARLARYTDAKYFINPECLKRGKQEAAREVPRPAVETSTGICRIPPQPGQFKELCDQVGTLVRPMPYVPARK